MSSSVLLGQLNALDSNDFAQRLGDIFEHSPWIAARAWGQRPFVSVDDLHAKMCAVVEAAERDAQLELLRAHPELAGKAARAGELTEASTGEQHSAGLDALDAAQIAEIGQLNRAYRERFGFPFIIAVLDNTREQIFARWRQRLDNDVDAEMATALQQVYLIARLRLEALVTA